MCGRYTLTLDADGLAQAFPGFEAPKMAAPRYNIAPTQPVLAVPNNTQRMEFMVWGLIPGWSKDTAMGAKMINARGETLTEKPSFKTPYKRRRCLIPADGFYEWKVVPGSKSKSPMYIQTKGRRPFMLAGLWEVWHPGDENILSCTIITTEPNDFMAKIHNRMPVILPPNAWEEWLDPDEAELGSLDHLLTAYPADQMEAYEVSTLVNSPANDTAACIAPAA